MASEIRKIEKAGLCLGCGLCESICGKDSVEMKLSSTGFFVPEVKKIDKKKEEIIKKICPGVNVVNDISFDKSQSVWGKIERLFSGYSTDSRIRTKGSSGGIVSAIGVYMLEKKLVDAVLQVGGNEDDYERNSLKISRNKEDVLQCASSRYAPALVFDKILDILASSTETYCFIGKPCDISALKNLLVEFPQYKERFKLTVSIMCAGMPSFKGTKAIVDEFTTETPVKNLVYRGQGWPGYFSFTDRIGRHFQKTYNDSWGKTLNKHLNLRCKICPDGIGLQADIAVGDAWETKDGYPDFTEKEGQSLVIVRTDAGVKLLEAAQNTGDMSFETIGEEKIALMQPYQYARRKRIGVRVLAYTIGKQKFLNYRNMKIWYNLTDQRPRTLVGEFLGTLKRIISYSA